MALTALGIGSGLNLSSLLDQLQQAEQKRLIPLKTQKASYQAELTAYGKVSDVLDKLKSAAKALGKDDLYGSVKVSSDSKAFTATGSADAVAGHYQIDVTQLARAQSLTADAVQAKDATIGAGGTITLTLGGGEDAKTVDITLDDTESTLAGIRDAINGAEIGINASIIDDGKGQRYHLVLSSQETGTDNQITVSVADNADLADMLNYNSLTPAANGLQETVAAQDAELTINGINIYSQSNTVKDAIQGVTLTLTGKTTDGAEALSATRNIDAIKGKITDFVDAYNNYRKIQDQLTAYNGPKKASGMLIGDSAMRSIEGQLRHALNTPIQGSDYYSLAQIGISVQLDGTLEVDSDKLDKALNNNLDDVKALLGGTAETDGFSSVLTDTINQLSGGSGLLSSVTGGIESSLDRVQERMVNMQESINSQIDRYRQQFQQLDQIMAQLNSTKSYLSQQLGALNNNDSDS